MKKIILWFGAYLCCFFTVAQENAVPDIAASKQLSGPVASREVEQDVAVYPNPSNGRIFLSFTGFKGKRTDVQVMNVIGNVVFRENFYETQDQTVKIFDLSKFDKGLYYIKLEATDYSEIRKVIIN